MKNLALFIAILAGVAIPQASALTFLIRYSLMCMMFFSFLDLEIRSKLFQLIHIKILAANLILPLVCYQVAKVLVPDLAAIVFIVSIMPTAIAATVIIGFLKGNTPLVVTSVLITNVGVAIILPVVLPYIVSTEIAIHTWEIMLPVGITVFVPLGLAFFVRRKLPKLWSFLLPFKPFTFYLFVGNVFLACAKASHFIQYEMKTEPAILLSLAIVTFVIFVLNFVTGELLGKPTYRLEAQQSLGRKNTMFGVWLALTFIDPIAALGPICYILYQNAFNSYQIAKINSQ